MSQSSTRININLRNKGIRNTNGHLMKGCVKDATSKLSIGSIPSNYQTIIYHSQSTKAFGSSQKRFYQRIKSNGANTESIIDDMNETQIEKLTKNASHSIKGYGSFLSKDQRNWIMKSQAPGPGKYHHLSTSQSPKNKIKKRRIFSRERKIKISQNNKENKLTPGPAQYYIKDMSTTNNGWKSSFITKLDRTSYLDKSKNPGPGYYDVKLVKNSKTFIRSIEKFEKQNQSKSITKMFNLLENHQTNQIPGPGSYQYQMPAFKPLYERIKISRNFIMPKKDRFNDKVDKVEAQVLERQKPNVYSYNLKSEFQFEPRLLQWPCFMSDSKRIDFASQNKIGPSSFNIVPESKKNFRLNIKGDWL